MEKSDKTDYNSPYELAKMIATLRGDKAALVEVRDEFQEALKARDAYIEQLEQHLSELKTKLVEQEEFCAKQSSITRRHEMTKDFALRQVESLKEQLVCGQQNHHGARTYNFHLQRMKLTAVL